MPTPIIIISKKLAGGAEAHFVPTVLEQLTSSVLITRAHTLGQSILSYLQDGELC